MRFEASAVTPGRAKRFQNGTDPSAKSSQSGVFPVNRTVRLQFLRRRATAPQEGKSGGGSDGGGQDPEPLHRQHSSPRNGRPNERFTFPHAKDRPLECGPTSISGGGSGSLGSCSGGGSGSRSPRRPPPPQSSSRRSQRVPGTQGRLRTEPTWADVAPIFAEKCAGCHTPGGIAPFSLR